MELSLQSKYKSKQILAKRNEMIEAEKLHIKDKIDLEQFKKLYIKYGNELEEKEFAYAFLDIDDIKYTSLAKGKNSETIILSKQYIPKEEFERIREELIEKYDLKKISYNKGLELYEKFGKVLSFKLFSEEILGIDEKKLKNQNMKRYPDKEIDVDFSIRAGEYAISKGDMSMYVLNPEYILEIRNKIIYEEGLHIKESIDYNKFRELYDVYGKSMSEVFFATEVLDIPERSLNNIKGPKKFSTIILQNIEIPKKTIENLRNKIAILNKLEGRPIFRIFKIKRIS